MSLQIPVEAWSPVGRWLVVIDGQVVGQHLSRAEAWTHARASVRDDRGLRRAVRKRGGFTAVEWGDARARGLELVGRQADGRWGGPTLAVLVERPPKEAVEPAPVSVRVHGGVGGATIRVYTAQGAGRLSMRRAWCGASGLNWYAYPARPLVRLGSLEEVLAAWGLELVERTTRPDSAVPERVTARPVKGWRAERAPELQSDKRARLFEVGHA